MSAIHWFEIPVIDINRAKEFYDQILDTDLQIMDLTEQQGSLVAMLPGRGGVSGAIVQNKKWNYIPSQEGTMVYLVVDNIDAALEQVKEMDCPILLPKTALGEMDPGYTAWIVDTEGNRVGLYGK